jgi:hypothetical protein
MLFLLMKTVLTNRGCYCHNYLVVNSCISWSTDIYLYNQWLDFVSKCNVRYSLMFIYIHIFSYYKLFLYFTLCLRVMLDSLSCSFTSISFLTTSCSFTNWLSITSTVVKNIFTAWVRIRCRNEWCWSHHTWGYSCRFTTF